MRTLCLNIVCHVCATKVFNTFHICIYHKTLECLEMTRRGKGPSGRGRQLGVHQDLGKIGNHI